MKRVRQYRKRHTTVPPNASLVDRVRLLAELSVWFGAVLLAVTNGSSSVHDPIYTTAAFFMVPGSRICLA